MSITASSRSPCRSFCTRDRLRVTTTTRNCSSRSASPPPPKDWEEMFADAKILKEKGYVPFAQWGNFKQIELGQWNQQFSVGPFFAAALMDKTDYDKDGQVDTLETLRATKAGLFNAAEHDYAQEMYRQLKRMYTELLPAGWQNTDFSQPWNDGKVAMREEGLWALQAENGNKQRKFNYGVIPAPPITKSTSPDVADVQYTEKGPYQPDPDLSLNILKPIVKDNPDLKEAAVAFLKYLTVPENISMMVLEQGASLGAVKGSEIPPLLDDWMNNAFPIMPKASWPNAFTDEQGIALNKAFEMWVKGETDDAKFFAKSNEIQQKSADDYIKKNEHRYDRLVNGGRRGGRRSACPPAYRPGLPAGVDWSAA
ncbi:extracellular solute-binding protein [Cohnella rhizosphaerae]|uniref:Extracellular solute-binding protein n=1 Tax=Cohnella rhizosphaerae TaxID=1457232 RepID=A0A9X4QWQ9_9BACL|nr:extracellular solute-binding protein [Cohnella rhizosphaerae]MDG0813808.1 extracellular solute-binding protein [Cohnella rhizosphaerae]